MQPNTDNSRALGIGERIEAGDFWRYTDTDAVGEWDELSFDDIPPGEVVTEDACVEYRRMLPNTHFATGAQRSQQDGKGRFDLIPYEAMLSLARRYEMGAPFYGERNWENGMPLSRMLSSMRRHSMQIGYDFSEDHVGAVLWNAAGFVTIVERIKAGLLPKSLDDLGYIDRITK